MTDRKHRVLDLEDLMPDFRTQLEVRLVKEAGVAAARRPARRRGRLAISAGFAVVLAAVILVVANVNDKPSNTAFGRLRVLDGPTVDITRQLNGSLSVATVLGPEARLDEAHPIPFLGRTAYLVEGRSGWCLVAPDPASSARTGEDAVSCLPNEELQRFGIAVAVSGAYVAAVPDDVRAPTLRRGSGAAHALRPNELGVVVVSDLSRGDSVVRYSRAGEARVDRPPRQTND